MPTKPVKMFTSWSYSRWKAHRECPARAKYQHLDKLPEPKGSALLRGGEIDEQASGFLEGKIRKLPAPLKLFSKEFALLRREEAKPQQRWAVNRAWKLVEFFAYDAWGRMVLDAHYEFIERKKSVIEVIDFKTGKVYPENEEQLELYAIPTFIAYPAVDEVRTALWYLDQGEINGERTYTRKQLPGLIKAWEKRLVPMLTDKVFPPRPGDHCKRCHFRKSNGGPCKY